MWTRTRLGLGCLLGAVLLAGAPAPAAAKKVAPGRAIAALPAVVGLTPQRTFAPASGFVDDAITTDGTTLIYVVTDGATTAIAHVVDLATGAEAATYDVGQVTLTPATLELTAAGLVVLGHDDAGKAVAGLVNPAGKVMWRAAAERASLLTLGGKRVLALVGRSERGDTVTYSAEQRALATGKRIGKVRKLTVNGDGRVKKLGFTINHFLLGGTVAVGVKDGEWDRKANVRLPNVEATYDLMAGKAGAFVRTEAITDLKAHALRMAALRATVAPDAFVRWSTDGTTLEHWTGGTGTALELDQPTSMYAPASLRSALPAGGAAWLGLTIDPTNAEAVARKRSDTPYFDLFEIDGARATRRARLLATGGARYGFGVVPTSGGTRLWVLERNGGMDRGGKALTIYSVP